MIRSLAGFLPLLLCAWLLLPGEAGAQTPPPAAVRTWTTAEGRVFQATLVKLEGTQITLRLATGQLATVPLTRLSAQDQAFLQSQRTAGAAPAAGSFPPVGAKPVWPVSVEVDSRAIEVTAVKEDSTANEYVYQSKNFQFTSQDKLAGSVMKEIARTFEATYSLVQALPWGVRPQPPQDLGYYQAKFFVDHRSYVANGGPPNSGGVYFSRDRVFRVPFDSIGLQRRGKTWFKDENYESDTVVHEITHQMMHDFLPFLPTWAIEGTAEYTESLPFHAGRFATASHERGMKEYLKKMSAKPGTFDPVAHMKMDRETWESESMRRQRELYANSFMLIYFFCHLDGDGKGTRFLAYMSEVSKAAQEWEAFFKDPRVKRNGDGSFTYRGIALPEAKRDGSYGLGKLDILLAGRDSTQLKNDLVEAYKKVGVR